jgi:pimeloyl-ACP methyl ester carboxylesterase
MTLIPEHQYLDIGIQMHVCTWLAQEEQELRPPYLLVHGLASNARTWDQVARLLVNAGHSAAAIDQRGHGLSQKTDSGYDFATITNDIYRILTELGWEQPVMVGQSWGGNVLLEFAARYPGLASKYVFVDGGFLQLRQRGAWEAVAKELRPPKLAGTPRAKMLDLLRSMNPGWTETGIEGTMGNFEVLPDDTIRPWLTLERHMQILRAMYDQEPEAHFSLVEDPVLICAADNDSEHSMRKREQVQAAADALRQVEVVWFKDSEDMRPARGAATTATWIGGT